MKNARGSRDLAPTDGATVSWVPGSDDGTGNGIVVSLPVEGEMPIPLVVSDETGTHVIVQEGCAIPVLGRG